MDIRPATREDFLAFFKRNPPFSMRAIVAIKGDTAVGIGGYYLRDGLAVAFTDSTNAMTKRDIVKACAAFRKFISQLKMDIVAQCDPNTGDVLLRHFGFKQFRGDIWMLVK